MKLVVFILMICINSIANSQNMKGIIKYLYISDLDSHEQIRRTYEAELLISKTEIAASNKLIEIIKNENNSNPENLFRLSELNLRRTKTIRFIENNKFELNEMNIDTSQLENQIQYSKIDLKQIYNSNIKILSNIKNNYKNYTKLDQVIFNLGLNYYYLENLKSAKQQFNEIIVDFKNSNHFSDSILLNSEISFSKKDFKETIELLNVLDKNSYPDLYPIALYRKSWSFYNLGNTEVALNLMIELFNIHQNKNKIIFSLTKESLRDISLFLYEFKENKIAYILNLKLTDEEKNEVIKNILNLQLSHSKHEELYQFAEQARQIGCKTICDLFALRASLQTKQFDKSLEIFQNVNLSENNIEIYEIIQGFLNYWNYKQYKEKFYKIILANISNNQIGDFKQELLSIVYKSIVINNIDSIDIKYLNIAMSKVDKFDALNIHAIINSWHINEYSISTENKLKYIDEVLNKFTSLNIETKENKIYLDFLEKKIVLLFNSNKFDNLENNLQIYEESTKKLNAIEIIKKRFNLIKQMKNENLDKTFDSLSDYITKNPSEIKYFINHLFVLSKNLLKYELMENYLKYLLNELENNKELKKEEKQKNYAYLYTLLAESAVLQGKNDLAVSYFILQSKFSKVEVVENLLKYKIPIDFEILIKNGNYSEKYKCEFEFNKFNKSYSEDNLEKKFVESKKILTICRGNNLISSEIRFYQAKILQFEFSKQSLKSTNGKQLYLLMLKKEKFEKSSSVYLDAISLNPKNVIIKNAYSMLINTMINELDDFINSNILAPNDLAEIKLYSSSLINELEETEHLIKKDPLSNSYSIDQLDKNILVNAIKLLSKESTNLIGQFIISIYFSLSGHSSKSLILKKNIYEYILDNKMISKNEFKVKNESELNQFLITYFDQSIDNVNIPKELKTFLTDYIIFNNTILDHDK